MRDNQKGLNRLLTMVFEPILEEYDRLKQEIVREKHHYCHRHNLEHIHDFFGSYIRRVEMNNQFFDDLRIKIQPYFGDKSGHGFDHTERVYNMAVKICEEENADMEIVKASALLHDIARLREETEDICHADEGARMAREILEETEFPKEKISAVVHAIEAHRYSKGKKAETREAEILQDADRLDALGAIIISRVFQKVGYDERPIYDPKIPPAEKYDSDGDGTGINHFYEKILKIKPETFKTRLAREIAKERYAFVKEFVERFLDEWEGKR